MRNENDAIEKTAHGFVLHRNARRYEVKGIARQGTQLRVTVKASARNARDNRFELSTLDLYSARSRQWFAEQVARLLEVSEQEIRDDLNILIEQTESHDKEEDDKPVRVEMTDTEREEAMLLLKSPTLIKEILSDYEQLGYTGEETNKVAGYLVATSRKLEDPLSLLIQSRSGAGKSVLQDSILAFMPEEDFYKYSRITDQALFYKEEDALVHKILAIEEAAGMGGATYSIRTIQSAKKLTIASAGKDPVSGKHQTSEYSVRGPVSVFLTSTQTDFDHETLTRFLCVTVDESSDMTRKIHEVQREQDTLAGVLRRRTAERLLRKHHNAQRLLRPVLVINPYAKGLSFPSERLTARRDHIKYLGLIKTMALLFQYQREVKRVRHEGEEISYIEVTLMDIAQANQIAAQVLGQSQEDMTPQGRQFLGLIRKMLQNGHGERVGKEEMAAFSRRQARECTGWSDWQVRRHLAELVELEYLHVRTGHFGKEYLYQLGDGADTLAAHPAFGLTNVEALKAVLAKTPMAASRIRIQPRETKRGAQPTP